MAEQAAEADTKTGDVFDPNFALFQRFPNWDDYTSPMVHNYVLCIYIYIYYWLLITHIPTPFWFIFSTSHIGWSTPGRSGGDPDRNGLHRWGAGATVPWPWPELAQRVMVADGLGTLGPGSGYPFEEYLVHVPGAGGPIQPYSAIFSPSAPRG